MIALLIAASTPTPPPPLPPEVNQAFDCTVLGSDGPAFRVRGTARTLRQEPDHNALLDPIEIRFESSSPAFPSLERIIHVSVRVRSSVTVEDEPAPGRHLSYHLLINGGRGRVPAPTGAILITEWGRMRPAEYVATGLCDLQPLEESR